MKKKKYRLYNKHIPYVYIPFVYNTPYYYYLEKIHCFFLKIFRSRKKHPLVTKEVYEDFLSIMETVWPDGPEQMREFAKHTSLLDYCFACGIEQVYYKKTDDWFIVVTSMHNCYHLVEFIGANGKCDDIFEVLDYLNKNFKHKPFITECRDSTAYPLFMFFVRAGRIKILDEITKERKGDTTHLLKFKIINNS